MKELFENCKKLILDNYKGHINDSSLEAMTIAVMALCLKNEKRTLDKLPKILQNIEIFAEDKSVLEIAKNNISTFSDEMVDGNIGACVIRGFGTDDDTGEIYEEKCLVVSTVNLNDNPSDVIMKITHELTHLLRDQKFEADGKSIKTKNGISIVRVRDLSTGEKKTKHFYFEEGIVQRYTNQALDILREFVYKEELDDNSLLKRFRNDYPSKVRSAYDLQVQIVDTLCKDKQFDDAVVYDAYFNFDVHNITGAGLDQSGCQKHFKQTNGYTIPYGCLVPEKVDGLLLSGRNISGTHMAHSNFRAMPICAGSGEAAGIAAALAVKNNKQVREVTAQEIQKIQGK